MGDVSYDLEDDGGQNGDTYFNKVEEIVA